MSAHQPLQQTSSRETLRPNYVEQRVNGRSQPMSNVAKRAPRDTASIQNESTPLKDLHKARVEPVPTKSVGIIGDVEALDFDLKSKPLRSPRRSSSVGGDGSHEPCQSSREFVHQSPATLPLTTVTYTSEANGTLKQPLQETKVVDQVPASPPQLEDDPADYDLAPGEDDHDTLSIEAGSQLLFSRQHLEIIFAEPSLLLKFTKFLNQYRPNSLPVLMYYLDGLKALKAISYSNAIAEALEPIQGLAFSSSPLKPTVSSILEQKANRAFDVLVKDDLPAYITHVYVHMVSSTLLDRVTEKIGFHYQNIAGGLAETYCLSDPSRPDNPIVFASEGFYRTTQYPRQYAIGRNCRFLQGPKTDPLSVRRIREAVEAGREHCEVFLNYRRNGSTFMNLLMCSPLRDQDGNIRYFLGAQLDISGLIQKQTGLESWRRLVTKQRNTQGQSLNGDEAAYDQEEKDQFQQLSEMFNMHELETVRQLGGRKRIGFEEVDADPDISDRSNQQQLWIHSTPSLPNMKKRYRLNDKIDSKLIGFYQNYFLVRPYPSLGILFASTSVNVPGILQAPLMSRIGGGFQMREDLTRAFEAGRGVTAKIRWVERSVQSARNRWMHCTPLLGANGQVGVWMVILVDEDSDEEQDQERPVSPGAGQAEFGTFGRAYHHGSERGRGLSSASLRSDDGMSSRTRRGDDEVTFEEKTIPYMGGKFTAVRNIGKPQQGPVGTGRRTYKSLAPFSPFDYESP